MRRRARGGIFVSCAITLIGCGDSSHGPADVVFENGSIDTVNPDQEWGRALAVKGRRIVYVGDDDGVDAFKGPNTRVIDLAGRMVMPGFVEGHTHPARRSIRSARWRSCAPSIIPSWCRLRC
jgi:imidazolonepropionase-like amidohydrolase